MSKRPVGLIGLGTMGANLARNIERNGWPVVVYNRTASRTDAFLAEHGEGRSLSGAYTLEDLVSALDPPRIVLIMVPAGHATEAIIGSLTQLVGPGDVIVDGGNAHYQTSDRLAASLAGTGIEFCGMGVSGGEEGALHGPSLMPGCSPRAYETLRPLLQSIAAKADGEPCVSLMGPGGAGHFVKMVHNGIEYGDMQLIGEAYDLLRTGVGLSPEALRATFAEWNAGELESFLMEITARIVAFPDDQGREGYLVDHILDSAGQKGTGRWTVEAAGELGVPVPTISSAVDARNMSAMRPERVVASRLYEKPTSSTKEAPPADSVRAALYCSKVCSYAQGFALLATASRELNYDLNLSEIARIWRAGCIIRARFLDRIREAFSTQPELPNLLQSDGFRAEVAQRLPAWRETVATAVRLGIPVPAMSASLAYFDSYTSERLPANLLQAQRDYFGAHTYERTDRTGVFHTQWQ